MAIPNNVLRNNFVRACTLRCDKIPELVIKHDAIDAENSSKLNDFVKQHQNTCAVFELVIVKKLIDVCDCYEFVCPHCKQQCGFAMEDGMDELFSDFTKTGQIWRDAMISESLGNAKFLLFDHDGTLVDTGRFYQSKKPSKDMLNPETVGIIATTTHPYAIVAGTYRKHVEKTVRLLPRAPLFSVCLEDSYPLIKPDPKPYLMALEKISGQGIRQEDVVVFEDSQVGATSARDAGFRVVRVKSFSR